MVRKAIIQLNEMGRLPDSLSEDFTDLIDGIEEPVSYEEAEILVKLLPDLLVEGYGVDWTLLHLIESATCIESVTDIEQYKRLIDICLSMEWKKTMKNRLDNYKKI